MNALKQALDNGKFGITAEMAPPKGYDFKECMEAADMLKGKVHCVNVTDMQSSCLKASSLGLCIKLKEKGITPILQMTGRDRNRMALQAELFSAAAFGIDSVLALTGDHPIIGDVKDKDIVIFDDMVDTAGTLYHAAVAIKEAGARSITAAATHAVLSGPAVERIQESPIDELVVLDTVAVPEHKRMDKMTVLPAGGLFAQAIENIYGDKPMSPLVDKTFGE